MPAFDGNLALKRIVKTVSRPAARPAWEQQVLKTRRIPVSATPDAQQVMQQRTLTVRRALARRRLRLLVTMVLLVLFTAGVFGAMVYRQAMILEKNFAVVAMELEIKKNQKESSQIREALAQQTNLDEIRKQAIVRLGLQDPARSQLVSVRVPDTDRIVFIRETSGTADDAYLSGVFASIEQYFKTISIGNQGD
jgi:Tfp pilus assembly protein PilN